MKRSVLIITILSIAVYNGYGQSAENGNVKTSTALSGRTSSNAAYAANPGKAIANPVVTPNTAPKRVSASAHPNYKMPLIDKQKNYAEAEKFIKKKDVKKVKVTGEPPKLKK